jgi:DNA repair protein RecN (Recombination protein N)
MKPSLFLSNLTIQNFATFENQSFSLHPNFTCLVGETGSGKSLVFDAIQLLLGGRADKKQIRKGSEFCTIEGTFSCADTSVKDYLHQIGYPANTDELVIKRIIYNSGAAKTFLNYQACSLGTIQDFTNAYVDIVGQFENQRLLNSSYQLEILDHYLKISSDVTNFSAEYTSCQLLKNEVCQLTSRIDELKKKEEFLIYQINEIDSLNLREGEEIELLEKKNTLINLEKSKHLIDESLNLISESENFNLLKSLRKVSSNIGNFKLKNNYEHQITEFSSLLNDLSFELSQICENSSSIQDELSAVVDRLDLILKLKRKHGGNLDNIFNSLKSYKCELSEISTLEGSIKIKNLELEKLFKSLASNALNLHTKRIAGAKNLSKELTQKIQSLRMTGAEIELKVSATEKISIKGSTELNIFAKTNKGESSYLLKNIASGGELSRILLGLRELISAQDSVTVFLFDEIDTGLGGETALAIGEAIKRVSSTSQVIAITHLPQIASYANQLAVVHKEVVGKSENTERTISIITSYAEGEKRKVINSMNPLPN